MSYDPHGYLKQLHTLCGTCKHPMLNHNVVRGVRRHCCHGTATSICQCRKFVEVDGGP